jgi:hypothetical protein
MLDALVIRNRRIQACRSLADTQSHLVHTNEDRQQLNTTGSGVSAGEFSARGQQGNEPRERTDVTKMKKWILLLVMVCAACGDGGSGGGSDSTGDDPALPRRDDPAFGSVGNVLISDRFFDIDAMRDAVWIGFNRQQQWDGFIAVNQRAPQEGFLPQIGGRLIADASHHLGFYFDPDSTGAAEAVLTDEQTVIDVLKRDPQGAAQTPFFGWFIPASVEKIVSTKK